MFRSVPVRCSRSSSTSAIARSTGPAPVRVAKVMASVDFQLALVALPAYCFALMQNVSLEEQSSFGKQTTQLASSPIDPTVKSLLLGLALMNLVGDAVLKAAVDSLGEHIRFKGPVGTPPAAPPP